MTTTVVAPRRSTPTADDKHRRGRWPVATLRPGWDRYRVNGDALTVGGTSRYQPAGSLLVTSFYAELRPTLREILSNLRDPAGQLVPRRAFTGGSQVDEFESSGSDARDDSAARAVAAALRTLGYPVTELGMGARLVAMNPSVARASRLSIGEVIVGANGRAVSTAPELVSVMADLTVAELLVCPGEHSADQPRTVPLKRSPEGWGLAIETADVHFDSPVTIGIDLPTDLVGPSLGLAIALAVVDVCTPGSLTGGATVAATGCLSARGGVGGVGGLALKARASAAQGATLLLVPSRNDRELGGARRAVAAALEIVPVDTLTEALGVLVSRGGDPLRSRQLAVEPTSFASR
jgi:Lon-like protease